MAPPTPPLGDLRLHEESDEDDRQELQAVLGEVDTESQAAVAVGSQDHNQSADAESEQLAQRRAEERGSNDPLTNQQQQLRSRRSVLNGAALQVNDHDEMSVDWSTGPLSISDLDIPAAADEEANTERGEDFADAGVVSSAALVGSESTPKLAAGDRADVLSYSSAWKDTLTDEVDDLTPPLSVFLRTLHALRSPASPTNDCLSGTSSRRPRYTYHEEVSRLVASRLTKELCNNNRAFVRFIFPEFLQPERTNAVHALKLSEMENIEAHGGAVCCRVFRTGEGVYRCRDCALDETVVMCSKCYLASNHEGHDVLFSINAVAGGCCDCGDPEAWKIPLNCPYHTGRKRDLSTGESAGRSYVNLPAKVVDHWRNTLRYILEYVLETLAHSSTFRGGTAVSVEGIVERSQRLTREYGEEGEPVDFVLVLWNDESHTFSEVIDRIFSATGQSYTECNAVAHEVDRLVRD
ncbi:MAG: putative zinc finger in N-recognin-domain-containing protein, partial [Olpidium bornovanus]